MTRYVTAAQMKAIDRAAIEEHGIPAARLMENAGRAVADEAMKMVKAGPVLVLSGYGNNGGDGLVAARHLLQAGYVVTVFLTGTPKPFTPETEANFAALAMLGVNPVVVASQKDIDSIFGDLAKCSLIIDAIFGIGMRGGLDGFFTRLITRINALGAPIIAVDLPSGLNADIGNAMPVAIEATKTVALGFPKTGFMAPEAKKYIGELIVADIGLTAV